MECRPRTGCVIALALLVAFLLIAGCGGGDDAGLKQALREAEETITSWKRWAVGIGILALVIGMVLGSRPGAAPPPVQEREPEDRPVDTQDPPVRRPPRKSRGHEPRRRP